MKRAKALAVAFLVAFLLATPTAKGQQSPAQPTNLVLEVYFYPNEPPAYVVVPPAAPEIPQVLSKAKSVELVGIVPVLSTLPSYRMTLRDLSSNETWLSRL